MIMSKQEKDWPSNSFRTNLYIWKDLDHLKSYYAESITGEVIDGIADKLRNNKNIFKNRNYNTAESLGIHLNERCFCNLVEILLIDQSNKALELFFEKPV